MEKKHKLIYWILTILMFVPGVIGGVVEVFTDGPESIVKIMLFVSALKSASFKPTYTASH